MQRRGIHFRKDQNGGKSGKMKRNFAEKNGCEIKGERPLGQIREKSGNQRKKIPPLGGRKEGA